MSMWCGFGDRCQRRVFGDFVQLDALGVVELQELGQMPRDRLALAVGVGREVDFARDFAALLSSLMTSPLPLIVRYLGVKSCSTSTPSVIFGRSRTCPTDALTT